MTKVSALEELTSGSLAINDVLLITDVSASSSKKVTASSIGFINGWIPADGMTYGSADDPTYTMTCTGDKTTTYYAGQKIKLTQVTGGTKYFIITKVEYSSNTTLTLYGGTDYNLENEAITSPHYSLVRAPAGFPLDPTKWTVELKDNTTYTQNNPVNSTWYNLGTLLIDIPIGIWRIYYSSLVSGYKAHDDSVVYYIDTTLSTANNSESNSDYTRSFNVSSALMSGGYTTAKANQTLEFPLSLSSETRYYLNSRNSCDLDTAGSMSCSGTVIRAICAYL